MKNIIIFTISILLMFSCKESNISDNPDSTVANSEQFSSNELPIKWIDRKVDSVMKENNIPAISLGIVKDGKLVMSKGYGTMSRDTKTPVDAASIYQIGSNTKKLTGIIANNLINEKKLDLQSPIINYLPNSINDKAKSKLSDITLLHLLHQQSGIPRTGPSVKRIDGDPMLIPYTEEDLIHDLNTIDLDFEPGSEFSYSNFGYGVLGYICERVTNQTYEELINKYISQPYGMKNTTSQISDEVLSNLVTPYRKDDNTIKTQHYLMGKITPAGGVYSNVEDLSKLMINQIEAYKKYNSKNTEKFNPLILTKESDKANLEYGFGFGKMILDNVITYGHGGDMDGFASFYALSPEQNSGLILLTSNGGRWLSEFQKEIFYKLTNITYTPPKKSLVDFFSNLFANEGFQKANIWLKSNRDSEDYYLDESEMNNLGYSLLQKKSINEAIQVFELNTQLFPNSANAYDSLGEAYMLNEKRNLAINNYQKSLELNPENENAIKMIEEIQNKMK